MADQIKNDEASKAAEEAAREVAQAGELALDALNKALKHFSPARRLGAAFARVGNVFTEGGFRRLAGGMGLLGDGLFIVAEVLVIILAIGAAIKQEDWVLVPFGLAITGLILAIQYVASRFLEHNNRYIASWSTRLGVPSLPGVLAWLVAVLGLLAFISTFEGLRVEPRGWQAFWIGFGVWTGANFLAWALLHPALANVSIEQDTRGPAEILDVLAYFAKLGLCLVALSFGFAVLGALIWLVIGLVELFRDNSLVTATEAIKFLLWMGAAPFLVYVLALITRYNIGLGEAILSLLKGDVKR